MSLQAYYTISKATTPSVNFYYKTLSDNEALKFIKSSTLTMQVLEKPKACVKK